MKCPNCFHAETIVINTKQRATFTWRRRQCLKCGYKFTTREFWKEENK